MFLIGLWRDVRICLLQSNMIYEGQYTSTSYVKNECFWHCCLLILNPPSIYCHPTPPPTSTFSLNPSTFIILFPHLPTHLLHTVPSPSTHLLHAIPSPLTHLLHTVSSPSTHCLHTVPSSPPPAYRPLLPFTYLYNTVPSPTFWILSPNLSTLSPNPSSHLHTVPSPTHPPAYCFHTPPPTFYILSP